MSNLSAQGSITVKRLRNGDTLFITFGNNGIPLFQGVDPKTGEVSPDWSVAANQPVITPQVTSARTMDVTLSNHLWKYNGDTLVFNGATSGDWTTDSTGKFQLNSTTGALKIIQNLASKTNVAADTLLYSCTAKSGGVDYDLAKSVDIQIQNVGASSYYGLITATTEQISKTVTSTTIYTTLYLGATEQTGYSVKWYKDDELWTTKSGTSIQVTRSDVDGTQLIIAEFYKSSTDTVPVYRAGIRIIDTSDDYQIQHRFINASGTTVDANREVDTNKPVYVQAYVVNVRTNTEAAISGNWRSAIMDKDSWEEIASFEEKGANITVTITTEHTDRDGQEKDVEVVSEVDWTE